MSEDFVSMKDRKGNIKRVFSDPRKRMMLIVMGIATFAMLGIGFFSGGKQSDNSNASGTKGVGALNVAGTPGMVKDGNYNDAIAREDKRRLDAAEGDTSKSVVVGPVQRGDAAPLDPLSGVETPKEVPVQDPLAGQVQQPVPQPVVQPVIQQQAQPVAVAPAANWNGDAIRSSKRYEMLKKQMERYAGGWSSSTPGQEFLYNGAKVEAPAEGSSQAQTNASGSALANNTTSSSTSSSAAIIRAGTIVPAEMLTPLNSDAPGPVLARIVSGPFAGARVLGSFNASDKEITVQFRTLSVPGHKSSYAIDAYAVNPTLGVGLATDVNNHYFRRYGLSLAAGFLSEYGSAWARQGTKTTIIDGAVVVSNDDMDTKQINRIALGGLGKELSQELKRDSNIAPTVKAEGKENEGLPIGLLFMSDF